MMNITIVKLTVVDPQCTQAHIIIPVATPPPPSSLHPPGIPSAFSLSPHGILIGLLTAYPSPHHSIPISPHRPHTQIPICDSITFTVTSKSCFISGGDELYYILSYTTFYVIRSYLISIFENIDEALYSILNWYIVSPVIP